MSLPNISMPTIIFDCTLPVNKKLIKFHPFTVEDEKGFLSAGKSKDMQSIIDNYDAIIEPLIIDDIDLKKLCLIDYLYLCIAFRCKSKDEIYTGKLKKCKHCEQKNIDFELNILDSIQFINNDNIKSKFEISDDIQLMFGPVNRNFLLFGDKMDTEIDLYKYTIAHCVNMVIYKGEPYKDFTVDELLEKIISKMNSKQIKDAFIVLSTMIRMHYKITVNCPSCKKTTEFIEKNFLTFLK